MKYFVEAGGEKHVIDVERRTFPQEIRFDDTLVEIDAWESGKRFRLLKAGEKSYEIDVEEKDEQLQIYVDGECFNLSVKDERQEAILKMVGAKAFASKGLGNIKAPMPGLIVKVNVEVGQEVVKGQAIMVVEAMKMENEISSPVDGTVSKCNVKTGQAVNKGETMIVIDEKKD